MKFLYTILSALLLFFLFLPSSQPRSLEKRIRSLEANVSNLKHEVDDLLNYFKTCNTSLMNETVFQGFVNNYLRNETTAKTEDLSILQKLKRKMKKLLNFSKKPSNDELERFLRSSDDEDASFGCVNLQKHLMKFINCLDIEDGSERNATEVEEDHLHTAETTTQMSQKEREDAAEKAKDDTVLSFMGHLKHPVETIGRPPFKRPDLNKVQEQIENAKSSAWMDVEEMETTTKAMTFNFTEDPLEFFDLPNIAVIKRECSRMCNHARKAKRSDLFKGLLEPVKDPVMYEVPTEIVSGQQPEDENTIITNEVNRLATKINLKQQMELISFHEQLGDKPKRFDFDVEPFYQSALENITSPGRKLQENKEEDPVVLGAHKFFDFDAEKKKRSSKNGRIERLKQEMISEYKDHQFRAGNFAKMVQKVNDDGADKNEYKFLDDTYHLNDGSTHADEIIKPLNIVSKLKSPNEIKMEMELGEKFKELENYELDVREMNRKDEGGENAPFYKTENIKNESDLEELLSP